MIARGESPIEWAVSILRREITSGLYGTISFTLKDGLIIGSKTEKSEKPPSVDNSKLDIKQKNA